ncbi:MAG: hypothetical protein JWQ40_2098 [Segetibacter sp.]|nr:hypothetical protein [Segetibacter sp.]
MVSQWFETVIDNIQERQQKSAVYLIILLVLFIGAGSLYMLLNTTA